MEQQNTRPKMGLGRHQHTARPSNLKQMSAMSQAEERQADASQRQTQALGYRIWELLKQKGSP